MVNNTPFVRIWLNLAVSEQNISYLAYAKNIDLMNVNLRVRSLRIGAESWLCHLIVSLGVNSHFSVFLLNLSWTNACALSLNSTWQRCCYKWVREDWTIFEVVKAIEAIKAGQTNAEKLIMSSFLYFRASRSIFEFSSFAVLVGFGPCNPFSIVGSWLARDLLSFARELEAVAICLQMMATTIIATKAEMLMFELVIYLPENARWFGEDVRLLAPM